MAKYILNSVDETIKLGELLGKSLTESVIIRMDGEMGTGKTHFTKGLALGLGVREEITSPTFSILNIYEGRNMKLFHIDAYRLKNIEEAIDAGLAEVFNDDGVVVLEWGDLLSPFFENKVIDIKINDLGDNSREMIIEGWNDDSFRN
ncbi:MAG: tRNA (adenosine(37)-N6)-threonylcarbamoyltransferase complex ATPase subunit type 1 TsaE [Firmicutes bacterium]|nr:tRNA (adenosine(37)-N6)-threonylcarbamoyltransferase complex ATPase subunit type 1 TsaE [Bacillota bacterium]